MERSTEATSSIEEKQNGPASLERASEESQIPPRHHSPPAAEHCAASTETASCSVPDTVLDYQAETLDTADTLGEEKCNHATPQANSPPSLQGSTSVKSRSRSFNSRNEHWTEFDPTYSPSSPGTSSPPSKVESPTSHISAVRVAESKVAPDDEEMEYEFDNYEVNMIRGAIGYQPHSVEVNSRAILAHFNDSIIQLGKAGHSFQVTDVGGYSVLSTVANELKPANKRKSVPHNTSVRHYSVANVNKPAKKRTTWRVQVELVNPATNTYVMLFCLIDTGAEISVVRTSLIPAGAQLIPSKVRLSGAFKKGGVYTAVFKTVLGVRRNNVHYPALYAFATENLVKHDVVLGLDWLCSAYMRLSLAPTAADELLEMRGEGEDGISRHYEWDKEKLDPAKQGPSIHVIQSTRDDSQSSMPEQLSADSNDNHDDDSHVDSGKEMPRPRLHAMSNTLFLQPPLTGKCKEEESSRREVAAVSINPLDT
jgi:hypothetical protein